MSRRLDYTPQVAHDGSTFGSRLRMRIALDGMKQIELCRLTGIPAPNLSWILRDRAGIGLETMQRLAQALPNTDWTWLLTGERAIDSEWGDVAGYVHESIWGSHP